MLDPVKALAKLFSDDTNEIVTAFKCVIPKSFWINNNVLSNRNNVIFTKKWGPQILTHSGMTYTEYYNGVIKKRLFDPSFDMA